MVAHTKIVAFASCGRDRTPTGQQTPVGDSLEMCVSTDESERTKE